MADVGEDGRVSGVQEKRPRPVAALRPGERPSVIGVDQRHAAAGERVRLEAAQQADGVGIEVEDAPGRCGAAEQKQPPGRPIAVRRARRRAQRDDVMPRPLREGRRARQPSTRWPIADDPSASGADSPVTPAVTPRSGLIENP